MSDDITKNKPCMVPLASGIQTVNPEREYRMVMETGGRKQMAALKEYGALAFQDEKTLIV